MHFLLVVLSHSRTQLFDNLFRDSFNSLILERVFIKLRGRVFIDFIHLVDHILKNDKELVIDGMDVFL